MEQSIGYYFKKISDLIEKSVNSNLKKYNLTMSQGRIIFFLLQSKDKEITQKEIEIFFNVTHATISGIIKRLEKMKYISVDRTMKMNKIVLLPKSIEMMDVIRNHHNILEINLCKNINQNEKEQFIEILNKVYRGLLEVEVND